MAEEGVPFRTVAGSIGRHLATPATSVTPEEAADHVGSLAGSAARDNPTSSVQTRALLGGEPTHPGLVDDLDPGHYFTQAAAAVQ